MRIEKADRAVHCKILILWTWKYSKTLLNIWLTHLIMGIIFFLVSPIWDMFYKILWKNHRILSWIYVWDRQNYFVGMNLFWFIGLPPMDHGNSIWLEWDSGEVSPTFLFLVLFSNLAMNWKWLVFIYSYLFYGTEVVLIGNSSSVSIKGCNFFLLLDLHIEDYLLLVRFL